MWNKYSQPRRTKLVLRPKLDKLNTTLEPDKAMAENRIGVAKVRINVSAIGSRNTISHHFPKNYKDLG